MTVLMTDAKASLNSQAAASHDNGNLADVLFADDTLILECAGEHVAEFMAAIEKQGRVYGLHLHWGKIQVMGIRSQRDILSTGSETLKKNDSMTYLGSLLHADGKPSAELSRRLGMCSRLFRLLSPVWSHAAIPLRRKIAIP